MGEENGLKMPPLQTNRAVLLTRGGLFGPDALFGARSGQLCYVGQSCFHLSGREMSHVTVDAKIFGMDVFYELLKRGQAGAYDFHDVVNPAARGDAINDLVTAIDERLKTVEVGFAVTAERYCHNDLGKIS